VFLSWSDDLAPVAAAAPSSGDEMVDVSTARPAEGSSITATETTTQTATYGKGAITMDQVTRTLEKGLNMGLY
jgi:hypothetical protein